MRRAHLTTPPAPERVEVVYPDGHTVPLECVYLGRERGMHVWEAVLTIPLTDLWTAKVQCAVLPAKCEIRLGLRDE